MSQLYDEYLYDHISNVRKAFEWLIEHDIIPKDTYISNLNMHDESKRSAEEYDAYDKYFYGSNKSYKVVNDFNYAWLHHIHNNPHHWQYWVLQHDDEPEEALEIPFEYVIEMICDWWSFSFKSGNLYEIFDWYEKHKSMKLHRKTRELVEDILDKIRTELDRKKEENNHLEHHGVKGQKWGVQNGPPYPLSSEKLAENIYLEAKKREPALTSAVILASKKAGVMLHGLNHRLKTEESIRRKIETDSKEKKQSVHDAALSMKDTVRYTTISDNDSFVDGYYHFRDEMTRQGYKEVRCRNYFEKYRQGESKHKSVQSVFQTNDGFQFEVQFQTPSSQKAKDDKVPIYEERRKYGLSEERKKELEEKMIQLAEKVSYPNYIGLIQSHD